MAGNYPDVPSWRMAYDRDGTQGYYARSQDFSLGFPYVATNTDLRNANDESTSGWGVGQNGAGAWLLLFPEARDLDAVFIAGYWNGLDGGRIQVSADTTNGVDGTWTNVTVAAGSADPTAARNNIVSTTALAIKGIRWSAYRGGASVPYTVYLHLFGEIAPGENPNRLDIWHPTLDQRVGPAYFDWGNVARGSSALKQFRVKNQSGTLTAESVRIAMEILTDKSPSVVGWHQLSLDAASWLAQVNIGNLAPGAISQPITIRRQPPENAALGLTTFRLFAESTSWV